MKLFKYDMRYSLHFDEKFAQALLLITTMIGGSPNSPRGSFDELGELLKSKDVEPLPETSVENYQTHLGIYFLYDAFSPTTATGEREIVRHRGTGSTYVATKLTGDFWVLDPDAGDSLTDGFPFINNTKEMNENWEVCGDDDDL